MRLRPRQSSELRIEAVAAHDAAAADVIHCSSFCLGAAPTWREASSPFLNSISVGIDMMPYFCAVAGLSSTLSLTILTLPLSEPAISSSAGAIILQGPHHSAQKSTTTGSVALRTWASKSASETLATPMVTSFGWKAANPSAITGTYGAWARASRRAHTEVSRMSVGIAGWAPAPVLPLPLQGEGRGEGASPRVQIRE